MPQTVSLSLYRFEGTIARSWALAMMALARRPLARLPGIGFWKLCGSGAGEGFTPVVVPTVFAILATWPDEETARLQTQNADIYRRYGARAVERWHVYLAPTSARGDWSGRKPFEPVACAKAGPLAAMTRATLRPRVLRRFWRRVPRISQIIGRDPNVSFKIGIGEVPMLQQVTFSIWPSEQAMAGFARTGAHAEAIRAVRSEGWFREELYARFTVLSDAGTWHGRSPLSQLEIT